MTGGSGARPLLQDGPLTTDKLRQALGDDGAAAAPQMAKRVHCTAKAQSRKVRDKVVLFARPRCSC